MPDERKKASLKPSTSKKKTTVDNARSLLQPGEHSKRSGRPQPKYEPSYVAFTRSRYKIFETTNPFTSDYQKTYISANKQPTLRRRSAVPSTFLLPVPRSHDKPQIRVRSPSITKLEPVSSSETAPKRLSFELSNREKMIKRLREVEQQYQEKIICTCEASRPRPRDIDIMLKESEPKIRRIFREPRSSWLQRLEHSRPRVRLSNNFVADEDSDIFCFACCRQCFLCNDPYKAKPKPRPIDRNVKIKIGKK